MKGIVVSAVFILIIACVHGAPFDKSEWISVIEKLQKEHDTMKQKSNWWPYNEHTPNEMNQPNYIQWLLKSRDHRNEERDDEEKEKSLPISLQVLRLKGKFESPDSDSDNDSDSSDNNQRKKFGRKHSDDIKRADRKSTKLNLQKRNSDENNSDKRENHRQNSNRRNHRHNERNHRKHDSSESDSSSSMNDSSDSNSSDKSENRHRNHHEHHSRDRKRKRDSQEYDRHKHSSSSSSSSSSESDSNEEEEFKQYLENLLQKKKHQEEIQQMLRNCKIDERDNLTKSQIYYNKLYKWNRDRYIEWKRIMDLKKQWLNGKENLSNEELRRICRILKEIEEEKKEDWIEKCVKRHMSTSDKFDITTDLSRIHNSWYKGKHVNKTVQIEKVNGTNEVKVSIGIDNVLPNGSSIQIHVEKEKQGQSGPSKTKKTVDEVINNENGGFEVSANGNTRPPIVSINNAASDSSTVHGTDLGDTNKVNNQQGGTVIAEEGVRVPNDVGVINQGDDINIEESLGGNQERPDSDIAQSGTKQTVNDLTTTNHPARNENQITNGDVINTPSNSEVTNAANNSIDGESSNSETNKVVEETTTISSQVGPHTTAAPGDNEDTENNTVVTNELENSADNSEQTTGNDDLSVTSRTLKNNWQESSSIAENSDPKYNNEGSTSEPEILSTNDDNNSINNSIPLDNHQGDSDSTLENENSSITNEDSNSQSETILSDESNPNVSNIAAITPTTNNNERDMQTESNVNKSKELGNENVESVSENENSNAASTEQSSTFKSEPIITGDDMSASTKDMITIETDDALNDDMTSTRSANELPDSESSTFRSEASPSDNNINISKNLTPTDKTNNSSDNNWTITSSIVDDHSIVTEKETLLTKETSPNPTATDGSSSSSSETPLNNNNINVSGNVIIIINTNDSLNNNGTSINIEDELTDSSKTQATTVEEELAIEILPFSKSSPVSMSNNDNNGIEISSTVTINKNSENKNDIQGDSITNEWTTLADTELTTLSIQTESNSQTERTDVKESIDNLSTIIIGINDSLELTSTQPEISSCQFVTYEDEQTTASVAEIEDLSTVGEKQTAQQSTSSEGEITSTDNIFNGSSDNVIIFGIDDSINNGNEKDTTNQQTDINIDESAILNDEGTKSIYQTDNSINHETEDITTSSSTESETVLIDEIIDIQNNLKITIEGNNTVKIDEEKNFNANQSTIINNVLLENSTKTMKKKDISVPMASSDITSSIVISQAGNLQTNLVSVNENLTTEVNGEMLPGERTHNSVASEAILPIQKTENQESESPIELFQVAM